MIKILLDIFLFLSFLFIIILIYKKYTFKDFHWLFILFMILYNVFPVLYYLGIAPDFVRINMDLTYNESFLEKQLIISDISILIYIILLLLIKNKFVFNVTYKNKFVLNIKILYFILYPITLYFVIHFPWPEHGEAITFGNSIAAYLKNIELVLLIMIFVYYSKAKKNLYLLSYIIIILIDTQRTPLLVAFIAYIITSNNSNFFKYAFIFFMGIIILSIIAIYRNGVSITPINMLYPFYNEGIFGSYCVLQSFQIIQNYEYNIFTNIYLILAPFHDLVIKLIPNFYFEIFNVHKQSLYWLGQFLSNMHNNGYLSEQWTPMGGFFYIAEYNLMIPYFGPIIFILVLYFLIKKINNLKNEVIKVILYSNLFLFIKAELYIAMKYILFLIICYYSVYFLNLLYKLFFYRYIHKRILIENTH